MCREDSEALTEPHEFISFNSKTLQTCSEMFFQTHFSVQVLYLKESDDPYESPKDAFARLALPALTSSPPNK